MAVQGYAASLPGKGARVTAVYCGAICDGIGIIPLSRCASPLMCGAKCSGVQFVFVCYLRLCMWLLITGTPEAMMKQRASCSRSALLHRWDIDGAMQRSADLLPRFCGHLAAVNQFDAAAFAVSCTEAKAMDPQQRLLLEHAAEAVRLCGDAADGLQQTQMRVGTFVGLSSVDYSAVVAAAAPDVTAYTATGDLSASKINRCSCLCSRHADEQVRNISKLS